MRKTRSPINALIISVLLYGSVLFAAQPAKEERQEIIDNFDYGLVSNLSSNKQRKESSPFIRNFWIDEKIGSLVKVDGFEVTGSSVGLLSDFRFGDVFYHTDGSKDYILSDGSMVIITSDLTNFSDQVPVVNGFDNTRNIRGEQIEDNYWLVNGANFPVVLTSTRGVKEARFAPIARDIEYFDGRVWMIASSTDPTEVIFSNIASTDGFTVQPDDPRAWSDINRLYFGRGDGEDIIFGRNYRGVMVIGKENSMWRVTGTNKFNYDSFKLVGDAGCVSADSVVESDGFLYCQGRDGEYEFNLSNMRNITDHIQPDVDTFRTDTTRVLASVWDTEDQFSVLVDSTNARILSEGSVQHATNTVKSNTISGSRPLESTVETLTSASSSTVYGVMNMTFTVTNSIQYYPARIRIWARSSDGTPNETFKLVVRNSRTGEEVESPSVGVGISDLQIVTFDMDFGTPTYIEGDVNTNDYGIKTVLTAGDSLLVSYATVAQHADVDFYPLRTGQYISNVATTTATTWSNFQGDQDTNGGTVQYYVRSATSSVNIATLAWTSIASGSLPPFGTNTHFQWASSFTATQVSPRPKIKKVTFNYIEGFGSNTRSFAERWNGRVWTFVSTETTGNFPLAYVKSKETNSYRDAFTVLDSMKVRSIWKDREDVFYAGGSTAAIVYRLDFGTNHDGAPITATYDTPDMPFGNKFFEKEFDRWMYDVETGSAMIKASTSVDEGAFTEQSIPTAGDGRKIKTRHFSTSTNISRKYGKSLRMRVTNDEKDMDFQLNALNVIYKPTARD